MRFTIDGFNQAKSYMASAFNKALDDAERLRKAAMEVSGDGSAAVPAGSLDVPGDASRAALDSTGNPTGKAPA